jgi:hypothetical protein
MVESSFGDDDVGAPHSVTVVQIRKLSGIVAGGDLLVIHLNSNLLLPE